MYVCAGQCGMGVVRSRSIQSLEVIGMTGERETRVVTSSSGAKLGESELVNGVPHGKQRLWNELGVLVLDASCERGEYHGEYRAWWDNGNLKERGSFNRGKRVGVFRWYTEDGELLKEQQYGNDF